MKKLVCLFALSIALPSWGMNSEKQKSEQLRQCMLIKLQNIVEKHEECASQASSAPDNYLPCKIFAQTLHAALSAQEFHVKEKTNKIVERFIADPTRIDDLRQATLQLGCSVYITWEDLTQKIPEDKVEQKRKDFHDRLKSTLVLARDVKEAAGNDTTVAQLLNQTIVEAGALFKRVCTHVGENAIPPAAAALPTYPTQISTEQEGFIDDEQEYIPLSLSRVISRNMSACTFIFLLFSGIGHVGMVAWNHVHQNQHPIMAPPHHGHSTHADLFPHSSQAAAVAAQTPNPWQE